MSDRIVYFNGRFVAERDARISIYDSVITTGDMAFEVTRTYRQQPFRLGHHIERLYHSLSRIGVEPGLTPAAMEAATLETLARNLPSEAADVDWNIIHNVSSGPAASFREAFEAGELRPTVLISCFPMVRKMAALCDDYARGVDLVVPPQRALPHSLWDASIKTRSRLHYHLAAHQAEAISPGAYAVMVNPSGYLTEGTSGNLFLVRGGELLTPDPSEILLGVTRGMLLELATAAGIAHREAALTEEDALAADEIFLTSTSIGVLHGRSFNGRSIGDGRIGPVTAKLRQAFEREVGLDFAAQARSYAARLGQASTTRG